MVFTISRSKHIHSTGILSLALDQSGTDKKTIYCCSSDETFGLWTCSANGALDVDIQNTANNCNGVLAIYGEDAYLAETGQDVMTGIEQQIVVKYGLSAFLSSAPLLSFSLEVTALACDGFHLIAGSNDFSVKCVRLDDRANNVDRFECDSIVVSISISPNGEHFSLSTAEGFVQIRSFGKGIQAKKPVAKFKACDHFTHIKNESPRIQCSWHPTGKSLFIPSKEGVIVVDCSSWEKANLFCPADLKKETFSTTSLSTTSEHRLLAASTLAGSVVVWALHGEMTCRLVCVQREIAKDIGVITSIIFSPQSDDILLVAFSEGYICSVAGIRQSTADCSPQNSLFDQEALSVESRPGSVLGPSNSPLQELDDTEMETDIGLIKSQYGFDQDGIHISERISSRNVHFANNSLPARTEPCVTVKGMQIPKSFGNGSSPTAEAGRYLCWNSHGIIKNYKSDDESTVEICFHDATVHHEIILDNTNSNYVLGDMNSDLVALASKKNANKESELYVHHISSWDPDSRIWTQPMGEGEVVQCLCVGHQFVAIFTDLRFLRIFTAAGTQRFIISLASSLLTMCASGSQLVTAQPTGGVIVESEDDCEHQLVASLYELDALAGECSPSLWRTVNLPLSPLSQLCWLQFSSSGNLVSMDDGCTVRLYLPDRGVWIPILVGAEILKDPEADFLWPISLHELPHAQFRYIYCRNAKHPPVGKSPPPPTAITLSLPVLNSSLERGKLEARLLANELQQFVARQRNLASADQGMAAQVAQITQHYIADLMKLFSVSCQMSRENRAAELAHRATNPKIIQGLCNYAAKVQRPILSEKVAAIGRERLKSIEDRTNQTKSIVGNVADETVIAPKAKILMTRKRIQDYDFSSIDARGKIMESEHRNEKKITELCENDRPNEVDDSMTAGMNASLDTSSLNASSLIFSNSMLLDASITNNPFKKSKPLGKENGGRSRGFVDGRSEDDVIVDFFDTLSSSNGRKKK